MCDKVDDIIKREVARVIQEVVRPMLEDAAHAAAHGTIKALKDEGLLSHQVLRGWKKISKYVDGSDEPRNVKPLLNFGLPVAMINGKAYSTPDSIQLWLQVNIEHQVKSRKETIEKKARDGYVKRELLNAIHEENERGKIDNSHRVGMEEERDSGEYFAKLKPKR